MSLVDGKTTALLTVHLICFLLAAVGAAARPNLVPNSSFEQGRSGWNLWLGHPAESSGGVAEAPSRWGKRVFKVVNRGTGGANLYSDPIPAVPGVDYTLSVYAHTHLAAGVRVALWAEDTDGKVINYEVPYAADVPGDQPAWARFKTIVRAPENCAALKAHLICNGGTVWWDGVQLESSSDSGPYREGPFLGPGGHRTKNRLANSGFKDGETDWQLWHQFPGRSSGGVVEGVGRDGSRGFHVVNPGGGGANLYSEPVQCKPNTVYTLSVYARVVNGARVQVAGWVLDSAQNTVSYAVGDGVTLPQNVPTYRRFATTFTTPSDGLFIKAHLICNGGEVWWDDCQLEQADRATGYEPGASVRVPPREKLPQAVEYTGAIIREARLRDVLAQTQRLVRYAGTDETRAVQAAWIEAGGLLAGISDRIQASYLVPDYRNIDYGALNGMTERAEHLLSGIWRKLGYDPQGIFTEWRPRLEGNIDKTALATGFFIFPCFTRDFFFKDEGNWDLLKPFGFRIVSGWWGIGVSATGELRPENMERILGICSEHGYRCDIAIDGAYAAATVLRGRLGEAVFLHSATGEWSPSGNCHNTINIWHPEVRRVAADYLVKAAVHFAKDPGVISYELTNEPSLTIEKRKHGYQYEPLGVGGYSPEARKAWRAWLKRRYKTVNRLNARWRTECADFGDAAPPTDLKPPAPKDGRSPVPVGSVYDFQTFRAESHAAWFTMCVKAMHRGDSGKAVLSQFWGGCIDRKEAGVDLRRMAEDVPWDIYGTHDWPGDRPASLSLYAVSMNRRANRPHWEDEFIWSQWEKKGTPEPVMRAALERNLWRQVAWGKRGISLFNLESEWLHNTPANWNNSMLNIEADLEIPRYSVGVIPTIERKSNLFKGVLYRTHIVANDVALLRPTAATLVTAPDRGVRDEARFLADRLLEQNILPELIPEEHVIGGGMGGSGRPKMLVAPWAVNVPDALQARLIAWVRQGGVVFATGPIGLFDEYGKPSGSLLKAALGELDWTYDEKRATWCVSGFEGLKAGTERRTLDGSSVPLLIGALGRGRLYLWPERLCVSARTNVLHSVVDTIISVRAVDTLLDRLEIIPRSAPNGEQYLFVTNLDARTARNGEIAVRGKFDHVQDLSCEVRPRVPVVHAPGITFIPLVLPPGGAVFLALGPEDTTARLDIGAVAASLRSHYRRTAETVIENLREQGPVDPAQAVRRNAVLARIEGGLVSGDVRKVARFACCAESILALQPRKPDLLVPPVTAPVKVDAEFADWPDRWTAIPPNRVVTGQKPAKDDLQPRFQLLWDDQALYLACQVGDDRVMARSGTLDLWKADCAEVFLDLLIDHSVTGPDPGTDDYQFFLTPAGGAACSHSGAARPKPRFAAKPVDGGWALEMALPWEQVGIIAPAAGFTFGFDLGIDDADESKKRRETQLMWHGAAENYRDTRRFGVVRLTTGDGR